MSMEHLVSLTAALQGTSGTDLAVTLRAALDAAAVRQPDAGSTGSGWHTEPLDPPRATLDFSVVTEDHESPASAVAAVEASLIAAGVILTEPPRVVRSQPVLPPEDSPRDGLHFDSEAGTLTIDGKAIRNTDVEVDLAPGQNGGYMLQVAVGINSPGGRREFRFPRASRIVVRRIMDRD